MGSGRVPTWIGLAAALALAAPATAQPPARPVGLSLPTDDLMPGMTPVPPRTAYQPPPEADYTLPPGALIPVPQSKRLKVQYIRRYGTPQTTDVVRLPDGTWRLLFTGGVIVHVSSLDGTDQVEFATDDAVLWVRGGPDGGPQGGFTTSGETDREVEAYLSGNVVIRSSKVEAGQLTAQTLYAEQVYYDASRKKAIALRAQLELKPPQLTDKVYLAGEEVRQLDSENWEVLRGTANASKVPSDPGLRMDASRFTYSQRTVQLRNVFGIPYRDLTTGERVEGLEQIITGRNVVTRLGGVPVYYTPYMRTDVNDPLGPLESIGFSQNRIFGAQITSTWDLFDLLALRPPPGHKWTLNLDYLSERGPAAGTDYLYRIPGDEPGAPPRGNGLIRAYGISDEGEDIIGGLRGPEPTPQKERGRFLWRHQQEVVRGTYFQGQLALLSDKNFLEQYYKNEFDLDPNQETFGYLTWQRGQFAASGLVEGRLGRNWVSETNWLPRLDGAMLGQTFLDDRLVYTVRGSAGYAQSRPSEYNPYPLLPTDQRIDTGRFDLWQELSVPFALGPVKLAPYGLLDLTQYTSDLTGEATGRVYGGGGARASIPFSRLYPEANSELFNVNGLYHKIVLGANYRYARSNVPFSQLPLLDRLNDDVTDQAWRNITPFQPAIVPGPNGPRLRTAPGYSPYNPQLYAIRRLVENRVDTLDDINVLQLDLRQRFQTKRGYPGMEHTVDFFTLDLSASYFPDPNEYNFGHPFAFLEYGAVWNIGDRTAVLSNGWFEPYQNGSRYYNVSLFHSRSDRTSVAFTYRQTDPLNSKAVGVGLGYQLSRRYYVSLGAHYDFGLQQSLANTFTLTRTGADLTVSVGFTYNAFVNTFNFQFLVTPNLLTGLGPRFAGSPIGSQNVASARGR